MTTPARQQEAQRVAAAYQIALTQLGVQTMAEALALWSDVPPGRRAAQSGSWLSAALRAIMVRRRQTVTLARAYYRLSRALITDTTVADPTRREGEFVSLDQLRREFATAAGPRSGYTAAGGSGGTSAPTGPSVPASSDPGPGSDRIRVEQLPGLREAEAAIEREAEQEIRLVLVQLGPSYQDKLLDKIDNTVPAKDADKLRGAVHKQAGARQAAAATRIAMNGARSTTWNHQERDKRAIGWARVSQTGTPCGWCAMLISRGAVYRSEKSAQFDYTDGDTYHDNCHCVGIPIYNTEQFANDPRFNQNREFQKLWPTVTEGLGGDSAVSAWRRFIRQQQRQAAPRRVA